MFTLEQTEEFQTWLDGLDNSVKPRIAGRLTKIIGGNFGDHKALSGGLYELRFSFGAGYRVFYTIRGKEVVLLLAGGDKRTQAKAILRARLMLEQ